MTTQRTFEPHEFAPYAEANNICRHCDRGRYALHHEQPRPEQAGRLAALDTWCECGHAKYNHGEDDFSSQDCHVKDCDCDSFTLAVEHDDAPAAPKRGDVLESQEFYELMQAYRHAGIADQDQVVAAFEAVKTYVHEQHSTLIEQRERLIEVMRSLRLRHQTKARVANFNDCGCDDCILIQPVFTTIEQEQEREGQR